MIDRYWRRMLAMVLALMTGGATAPSLRAHVNGSSNRLELATELNRLFTDVADKVSPSVVVLKIQQQPRGLGKPRVEEGTFFDLLPGPFKGWLRKRMETRSWNFEDQPPTQGQGSGIIIREDGHILTNYHVIQNAKRIVVQFKNGLQARGTIQGKDPQTDLAVIRVDRTGLPAADLGDSDKIRVGEFAVAIGAPFDLDYSVTFGHISAIGRMDVLPDRFMQMQDFIQTDANINPGNSGGPLVDLQGRVIGVNTLIRGMNTGIGFAIPINLARRVSDGLINHGEYRHPWLGVGIESIRISPDSPVGAGRRAVLVTHIVANSPASNSDLRQGDIVLEIEGEPVLSVNDFIHRIREKSVGDTTELTVLRQDAPPIRLVVEVGHRPASPQAFVVPELFDPPESSTEPGGAVFGIHIDPESSEGAVVSKVDPGSVAESQGVQAEDRIVEAGIQSLDDLRPVESASDYQRRLDAIDHPARGLILLIERDGRRLYKVLKPPASTAP